MEHGRDEEQEGMIEDIIRQGQEADGSSEEMEVEADGSGEGTLVITKSGEVY